MQFQLQAEGFRYRLVCNIIMTNSCQASSLMKEEHLRWPNTTTSNNKIIIIAHTLYGFDDFCFVIGYNFDSFEIL